MKFKLLVTTAILIISASAFSQGFKIGIKGGSDIYKIDGKAFTEQFSYGYQAGAFFQIGLSPKFGIQPEILFSEVNVDTSENFSDIYKFNNTSKIQLRYLKFPLLLNYNPNPFVSLQVGPQYGILMEQSNSLTQNGKSAFTEGDFSVLGGIQLNISKLRIYGRYAVGLTNINDIDNQDNWKSQNIQIGLGLAF